MRTRQRIILGDPSVSLQVARRPTGPFYGPWTYSSQPSGTLPFKVRHYMIDDKDRTAAVTHDCFHVKERLATVGFEPDFGGALEQQHSYIDYMEDDGANTEVSAPSLAICQSAMAAFPEMTDPVLPWRKDLQSYRYRDRVYKGWNKPQITFYRGFSAVNFLLEFRQNLSLIHSWVTRKGLLKRYHALRAANRTRGDRLAAVANERLAHVYGTELLIADARTLLESLTRMEEQAKHMLERSGQILRIYSKDLDRANRVLYSRELGTRTFPVFAAADSSLRMTRTAYVKMAACFYYRYSLPNFKSYWSRLRQMCDAFGCRLDAGVVWDSIPYSFVVDWFINVSEWLHRNVAVNWYQVDLEWLDFCHSAKVTYEDVLHWKRRVTAGNGNGVTLGENPILTRSTTVYRRQRDNIPEFSLTTLKRDMNPLKPNRIINAASLLIQKSHKAAAKIYDQDP